jgi:GNAT superfamily N-acetyltransferase
MAQSMDAFSPLQAAASPGGRYVRFDGVGAVVTPAAPERSLLNGAGYATTDALAAGLPRLAEVYEQAGVRAWSVWVNPGDEDAGKLLADAGLKLDSQPRAMAAPLDELELGDGGAGIDWARGVEGSIVGRVNARAYGYDEHGFVEAFEGYDPELSYSGFLDGEPAATVMTTYHAGDCGVWWVATLPEGRGRGLSSGLMRQALLDARDAGCETTSLQATAMGYPIYARIGYRDLGEFQMWEHRR